MLRFSAQWVLAVILALALVGCAEESPEQQEYNRLQARAERVEIIRDDFGVPHIYGETDADAVFGLMYAQAEDDFPRIERNYIWAIGRLAEVEGEAALYSDLRARLYMTEAEAKATYDKAPDWLKSLIEAWADGLNWYLAKTPDAQPKLLDKFEPWMTMYFFEGSIGGDIEQIPLAGIKDFYGAQSHSIKGNAKPDPASEPAPQPAPLADREPKGSNGFALAGKLTKSGKAMLLINPHTSFYFRGEVHMVSEEGLNAYGAVTWGQFFVYQGFNQYNGWMHTSTHADFIDEFVEDVSEQDGQLAYRHGDETKPVWTEAVSLKIAGENGTLTTQNFDLYRTHHGPITHLVDGKWTSTAINWDPVTAISQSWLRTKTKNHGEFMDMMQMRTNSSNNTVYADRDGTIAYYHGNFMPVRDAATDYQQPIDGTNPALDWQGKHALEDMIIVVNPDGGWLQNANSTPFTAAGANSPKPADYPAYMAPDKENFRGVNAVRLLQNAKDMTLDSLLDLAYNTYLPAFEVLVPAIIDAHKGSNANADTMRALGYLATWDYRYAADSIAMTMGHFMGMNVLRWDGFPPDVTSRMEKITWFAAHAPDDIKRGLLTYALGELKSLYGTWDQPWGAINRFQRLDGNIKSTFDDAQPSLGVAMASGRWGALAAYGSKRYPGTHKLYGYRGNSFVAVVEFGDKVRAKTLLAGGQSNDPTSPHFFDQGLRYVYSQFKDAAYYRADVEARAQRRYRPGLE